VADFRAPGGTLCCLGFRLGDQPEMAGTDRHCDRPALLPGCRGSYTDTGIALPGDGPGAPRSTMTMNSKAFGAHVVGCLPDR
jgi:hypothetical protein